jgi:hypothetical protein
MKFLHIPSALILTLAFTGCSSTPEVTFTTPPAQSSSASVQTLSEASSAGNSVVSVAGVSSSKADIPKSVQIDVPFASQAPLGNWEQPYQDACEEAALILAHYYITGETLTPEIMDKEILAVVAWEMDHGYGHDVTMEELAIVARGFYGHEATVRTDVTAQTIKEEIAEGRPVILPLAGREIGNPYYSGEGPWYHALLVTGYDGSRFITNDVGTKRGEDYPYAYNVLLDAVHDWTGVKEEIDQGAKAMVIVK